MFHQLNGITSFSPSSLFQTASVYLNSGGRQLTAQSFNLLNAKVHRSQYRPLGQHCSKNLSKLSAIEAHPGAFSIRSLSSGPPVRSYDMIKPTRERGLLLHPLWRRLHAFGALTEADDLPLVQSSGDQALHRRGADVRVQGLHVITAGWACQMRRMASGRRQIFLFLLPGDVIGSFRTGSTFSFCRTVALTRLETIDMNGLLVDDAPQAVRTLVDAGLRAEDHAQGFLYGHMMRLGAGDAYSGMANLLLELHDRLYEAGLAEAAGAFNLPIGQRVLAQALGVSVTHVNNTLQRMVADGLIVFTGRSVRLLQRERMAALSDFEDVATVPDNASGDCTPSTAPLSYSDPIEISHCPAWPTSDLSPSHIMAHTITGDLLEA